MKLRAYSLILAILGVSCLSTGAAAGFTDVREYEWWIHQANTADGAIASTSITVPNNPHSHTVSTRRSVWDLSATYEVTGTVLMDTTVTLQYRVDGSDVSGCTWRVFRSTTDDALTQYVDFRIRCANATSVNAGTHTIQVQATSTNGNPVSASRTDIVLRQTDSVTDATLDDLPTNTEALAQHQQTRALVNTTHVHLDSHFNQTNALVFARTFYTNSLTNDSRELILAEVLGVCSTPESCNITVEPFSVVELPGFSDEEVGALLLFIAMLLFAFFQRWLFVAIASVIGIIDLMFRGPLGPEPVIGFAGTLLLLILGIVLQVMMDIRDAHLERKEEVDR